MEKFHYNPIALTTITKTFFNHLQTLYLYHPNINRFINDTKIITRKYCSIPILTINEN